jgi:hypothetical protein
MGINSDSSPNPKTGRIDGWTMQTQIEWDAVFF